MIESKADISLEIEDIYDPSDSSDPSGASPSVDRAEIPKENVSCAPVIPDPTAEDIAWADKIKKKKKIKISSRAFRKMVKKNQLWRVNFLFESDVEMSLNAAYGWSGSELSLFLLGCAICENHSEMALLLVKNGAHLPSYEDKAWRHVVADENNRSAMALLMMENKSVDVLDAFIQSIVYERTGIRKTILNSGAISFNEDSLADLIKRNHLDSVKAFLDHSEMSLSGPECVPIKVARFYGFFEIEDYLKTYLAEQNQKSDLSTAQKDTVEDQPTEIAQKQMRTDADTGAGAGAGAENLSNGYQMLSDDELLKTSTSPDGAMVLTTVFNFALQDVVRVQYVQGQPPVESRTSFSNLDDPMSIRHMFNTLIDLGGQPQSGRFKNPKRIVSHPVKPTEQK